MMKYLVKKCVASLLCVALLLSCMAIGSVSVFAEDGSKSSGTPHVVFYVNDRTSNNVFKDINPDVSGKISSFADTPDRNGYIFKGWYYDRSSDSRPVDFENDTFTEDTSVYARWIEVGKTVSDSEDESNGNTVGDFDLLGVQTRDEMYDKNYNIIKPAGLRFIASLRNDLLQKLDSISDKKVVSDDGHLNDVEYGILLTKEKNVQNWLNYASSHVDLSNYRLKYNGVDVNGIDTTVEKTKDYQGFVLNVDCTSDDYSDRQIKDHRNFDKYRLYTAVITYSDENDSAKAEPITGRAYIRYYDANGRLRTVHDDYDGTDTHGGASVSYNDVPDGEESEPMVYYSNVPLMISDANNLTTENADVPESRFEEDAVGAMYIDGDTAVMRMVKNDHVPDSAGIQTITVKSDFDLGGHTLSFDRTRLAINNDGKIYNGTYTVGPSALYGMMSAANNISISDLTITAPEIGSSRSAAQFRGLYCMPSDNTLNPDNNNIKLSNVTLNFPKVDSSNIAMYGMILNGKTTLDSVNVNIEAPNNSTLNIISGAYITGPSTSKTVITDSTVDINVDELTNAYGVQALMPTTLRNSEINMNVDDCNRTFAFNSTANVLNMDNSAINIDVNNGSSVHAFACGHSTQESEMPYVDGYGVINDCDIDVHVNKITDVGATFATCMQVYDDAEYDVINSNMNLEVDTYVAGATFDVFYLLDSAKFYISGGNYSSNTGLDNGVWIGHAIYMDNSANVTIDEASGNVNMHGGGAAIDNKGTSTLTIHGGKFSSPTHGGAYFGSTTNIYGGKFYNSYDANEEDADTLTKYPQLNSEHFGGAYITYNAVVNAQNAEFIGGQYAIRLRANGSETNNPQVTLTNCKLVGTNDAISVSVGSVTVNSGTTCSPEVTGNGTTIIDNR